MTELQKQLDLLAKVPHGYNVGKTVFKEPEKKYFVVTYYAALDDYENDLSLQGSDLENAMSSENFAAAKAPCFYGGTPEEAIQKCLDHYGK